MNYLPQIFIFKALRSSHSSICISFEKRCDKADKKDKQSFSGRGNKVQWKSSADLNGKILMNHQGGGEI